MTTFAPSSSSAFAVARPRPEAPPVMTATASLISTYVILSLNPNCRPGAESTYWLVGDYTQSRNTASVSAPGTPGEVGRSGTVRENRGAGAGKIEPASV